MKSYSTKAKEYATACFSGKRWGGNPLLIVVDAALTSTGLKYFTVVVPRVERFEKEFGRLSFKEFSSFKPTDPRLLSLFNNPRAWSVAIELSKLFQGRDDFSSMKDWAIKAEYKTYKQDPVGRITGVGLNTFQYLRMQVGVDATMPDRIIWRSMEAKLGKRVGSMLSLIQECEAYSRKQGISQVELCWRIWLEESDREPMRSEPVPKRLASRVATRTAVRVGERSLGETFFRRFRLEESDKEP